MATITTILASDIIASSRVTLNTNFANLNTDKVDINSTYADPAWITSLAGSKITGNIGGNAATATALATARTIAGVSFDGTANIAIPSTGLSDSSDIVRGASSVASGQVLYGTAAGVAGSNTNLRYFVGTGNMVIGTTTDDGTNRLQVAGNIIVNAGNALRLQNAAANQFASMSLNASSVVTLNYPLSVGPSSALTSDVTLGVHNGTPTTGVTQLIVRAGAGQSTTNLQTWQNSGGTALAAILPTGQYRFIGVTVASLPAAAAGNAGAIAYVTDANSTTIGTTVAGGGGNTVLVWSNGTNWRIYAN